MNVSTLRAKDIDHESAAWQARVDLAAAHRLAVRHGFDEGIFNPLTLAVPGTSDRYYQIPFGLHWSEVTASVFMEVGYDGTLMKGTGEVERSCYCIHAPIHRLAPDAACVLHTHMPHASALTRLKDPRILPIGQTELGVMMETAYDQLYAMWTGQPLNLLPQEIIDRTIEGFENMPKYAGKPPAEHHFEALKRILDRREPDYRD